MPHLSTDPLVTQLKETIRGVKDVETALRSIAKETGVSHTSCARFSSIEGLEATLLTAKVTYPFRWQARYFLKQYAVVDPVIRHGKTAVEPFDWEELVTDDPAVRQFFEDAAKHGVGQNGYSIPVRPGPDADFSVVSFNSDHPKKEWVRFKTENASRMVQLAILIHSIVQADPQRHPQPAFLSKEYAPNCSPNSPSSTSEPVEDPPDPTPPHLVRSPWFSAYARFLPFAARTGRIGKDSNGCAP